MSRIGKKPVPILAGVSVEVSGQTVRVKGPKGELSFDAPGTIGVAVEGDEVVVTRPADTRENRALHGLTRALINNMVIGTHTPFEKRLEINGTGYQATLNGNKLSLQVGFANTIVLEVPAGVDCTLASATMVVVQSCDRQKCGQFAANIRSVRPPEPYKGKGIKYSGEVVRRKAGKAMV